MMNIGDLARLGSLGPSGWLGWLVYIRGALMATTKRGDREPGFGFDDGQPVPQWQPVSQPARHALNI